MSGRPEWQRTDVHVDGQWRAPRTGGRGAVEDPATEELIGFIGRDPSWAH